MAQTRRALRDGQTGKRPPLRHRQVAHGTTMWVLLSHLYAF